MVKNTENQVLAIVRDITNEKREQDYILKLSYKHHLTDLFNRRYFDDAVVRMDYAEYLPLSIIMIDVNGLKLTNDAFCNTVNSLDTIFNDIFTETSHYNC